MLRSCTKCCLQWRRQIWNAARSAACAMIRSAATARFRPTSLRKREHINAKSTVLPLDGRYLYRKALVIIQFGCRHEYEITVEARHDLPWLPTRALMRGGALFRFQTRSSAERTLRRPPDWEKPDRPTGHSHSQSHVVPTSSSDASPTCTKPSLSRIRVDGFASGSVLANRSGRSVISREIAQSARAVCVANPWRWNSSSVKYVLSRQ